MAEQKDPTTWTDGFKYVREWEIAPELAFQLKRICGTLRDAQNLVGTYVRFDLEGLETHLYSLISASDLNAARIAVGSVSDDDLKTVYAERFPDGPDPLPPAFPEAPDA